MTDNRILSDMRVLQLYSVIVLDASQHQRTMLRVITLGLLKQLVQRDGLRLVIKCANGDVDEVSSYLKDFKGRNICRIIEEISYEIEIIYLKKRHNYISAASYIVLKIHLAEDEGDILLFLAGEDDIDVTFHSISKRIEVSSNDTLGDRNFNPLGDRMKCYINVILPSQKEERRMSPSSSARWIFITMYDAALM
ncbi:probable pre-mRNA-splicing factor ATP-dependent RNA helicase DEAH5 [Prunus dulcis]|nr:probable pre-mRNA-splicing factor ATP-dependent RNA helicase DEAH5 [Prunus dulcis]